MKDPYEILGADRSASREELEKRYLALKAEYGEGRFRPGEEGAEAARKLNDVEDAWREINSREAEATTVSGADTNDFAYVDSLIKSKRYDDAQAALDSMTVREGEWHYYQAIVYYKREWLSESRKQLEAALECDPGNARYKTALDKLDLVIGSANVDPRTLGTDKVNGDENNAVRQGGDILSNCCLAYCLTSLCCDCTRCCM